jgi:hypothetical protein
LPLIHWTPYRKLDPKSNFIWYLPAIYPACSLGLSATNQQYFSLTTNQSVVLFSQNKPAPAISPPANRPGMVSDAPAAYLYVLPCAGAGEGLGLGPLRHYYYSSTGSAITSTARQRSVARCSASMDIRAASAQVPGSRETQGHLGERTARAARPSDRSTPTPRRAHRGRSTGGHAFLPGPKCIVHGE